MDSDFYLRVSSAIQSSGRNLRELEAETGISRAKLAKLGNGGRLYADEVPRICSALSIGFESLYEDDFLLTANAPARPGAMLDDKMNSIANQLMNVALAKVREEIGTGLDMGEVLSWYHSTGGRLAEHGQIAEYFSIFEEPETPESPLVAIAVGEKSLARESLNTRNPEEVTEYAASMNAAARFEITETYHVAKTTKRWNGTSREVEVKFRTVSEPFILTYDIVILPTITPNNKSVLLNFSKLSNIRPLRCVSGQETHLGTEHSTLLSGRTLTVSE